LDRVKRGLRVVPCELRDANRTIAALHRHHAPAVGHRFSLAALGPEGRVVGVCVVGRPGARLAGHPLEVAEVLRVATDGTPNACSCLLGAAARAARSMGYLRIQTYTLSTESGASLRGAGWALERLSPGGQWVHTDGKPRRTDQPTGQKVRWARVFRADSWAPAAFPGGPDHQGLPLFPSFKQERTGNEQQ